MTQYKNNRDRLESCTDRQVIFKALASILTAPIQTLSFEMSRALIDDLLRRAEKAEPEPDIIALLRASTEWGGLGAAMADVLQGIREQ